ncbi:MAG: RagB/SusD family nutrient uptake outer membrane protein [Bacteroidales bacterium]|nr:RagB/SusD family nutrient uptake outer membrane protein [Bacteroidales bacterium]
MKTNRIYQIIGFIFLVLIINTACTDLEEEILDEFTAEVVTTDENLLPNLVAPPLASLRNLWLREDAWGIQETSSDECLFPTRGTDWDDAGVWRDQYLHTWTPMHRDITATWNTLNSSISDANTAILVLGEPAEDDPDFIKEYRAQAVFLRSFYEYLLLDIYGIIPVRDPYSTDFSISPEIKNRAKGFPYLINQVKGTLSDIITREDAYYGVPNRDAALMLLAKLYLNKEVYVGLPAYDSCLIYLNELINTGHYALSDDYFNMFLPDNFENYKNADDEAILVAVFDDDDNYGLDDRVQWVKTTFHYNQTLGGNYPQGANWNGCMAPQGYLEECWFNGTDTATDVRWADDRFFEDLAVMIGFNIGQQYDAETGEALTTRGGPPLIFTVECPLTDAEENEGVRVLKFPPRVQVIDARRTPNDFLIWRYADALLMRAECNARLGDLTSAMAEINTIRTKRNAPAITANTLVDVLDKILIERGLELYWEGHRRQDLIRFGRYLEPKTNKENASPETALLCPIPQDAIDGSEGTIKQNPGY